MKRPNMTPGPWATRKVRGEIRVVSNGGRIATIAPSPIASNPLAENEGRAIAALPDMLAALEEACEFFHKTAPESGRAIKVRQALIAAGYTF